MRLSTDSQSFTPLLTVTSSPRKDSAWPPYLGLVFHTMLLATHPLEVVSLYALVLAVCLGLSTAFDIDREYL